MDTVEIIRVRRNSPLATADDVIRYAIRSQWRGNWAQMYAGMGRFPASLLNEFHRDTGMVYGGYR